MTNRNVPGAVFSRDPPWPEYTSKELGLSTGSSKIQRALTKAARWCASKLPIFIPWTYLAVLVIFLPFAARQRDTLALLLSGLGLEASLFPLAPSSDYRYSHWMVITVLTAAVLLASRRAQRGSSAPAP